MIKTYKDFFEWCEARNLVSDKAIAATFLVTQQTVRNWRKKTGDADEVQYWMILASLGYDFARQRSEHIPGTLNMPLEWFTKWRTKHGLETFSQTGKAFGVTRQAVHAWYQRERLPRWIVLGCLGYEVMKGKVAKTAA